MNIQLTPDYRLTADERQYIVQLRKVIDPTKGPNYVEGVSDATVREEYKDAAYYSLTTDGLSAAIEYVVMRTVTQQDVDTLQDFVRALTAETKRLKVAMA